MTILKLNPTAELLQKIASSHKKIINALISLGNQKLAFGQPLEKQPANEQKEQPTNNKQQLAKPPQSDDGQPLPPCKICIELKIKKCPGHASGTSSDGDDSEAANDATNSGTLKPALFAPQIQTDKQAEKFNSIWYLCFATYKTFFTTTTISPKCTLHFKTYL